MRSLTTIPTRAAAFAALLALSTLAACGDYGTSPDYGPGPRPPLTIDVPFCTGTQPDWVAVQDGDGPWTRVSPTVSGDRATFRHTFTTDRAAIAAVRTTQNGTNTFLSITYALPAELPALGDTNAAHCGPAESRALLGSVVGLADNQFAAVNAGFGPRDVVTPLGTGTNDFRLTPLGPGPQEILATRTTFVAGQPAVLSGIILRRVPDLPDGTTLPPLDFNSAEAFAPVTANVTITGLGAQGAIDVTRLRTAHGDAEISFLTNDELSATRTFLAIPAARLEAGDLQRIVTTAHPTGPANDVRSASVYFHTPRDLTITLGAPVPAPALSAVATTPSLRLRARFGDQADYDRLTAINYQQGGRLVSVGMTPAYATLAGTGYDLVVPDVSAAAGFDPRWALSAGQQLFWIVTRVGGTLGLGFDAVPTDGATQRTGGTFDTFTP